MEKNQAQEELIFIKKVMTDSQRLLVDDGKVYILWSGLVVIGLSIKFITEAMDFTFNNAWIWVPIIVMGWLFTSMIRRKSQETHARTFAKRILNGVWTAWGISIPILVLVGYFCGGIESWAVSPIVATIFGSGQFVNGIISNHVWIRNTAFIWWAGAIAMFVWPGGYSIALLGVMIILFFMVPGIVLYRKWKKDFVVDYE